MEPNSQHRQLACIVALRQTQAVSSNVAEAAKAFGSPSPRNSWRVPLHQLGTLRAFAFALLLIVGCTKKQSTGEYPERPIEVIVPFAPGGGSDTFARLVKAEIEQLKLLPYPLVIINAPGAGGTIGSRRAMNEASDGYTVLLLHDGILTAKHSGKVLYGPEAFEQIAGTGRTGSVVVVHQDSPHSNLSDLLSAAASQPDTVTFAANLGAPSHFVGLMLEQAHGSAAFRFAQTGGGADRFAALKGKHATATALSLEEYLRFRSDGVKALAFLGDKRHPQIPEIATAAEQDIAVRDSVMQYWWMPKGTPARRRDHFADVLKQAMDSPRFRKRLDEMKIDPIYLDGDQLASHLAEKEAALMRVDPGTVSPLPNVPLALSILAVFLCGGTLATRFRLSVSNQKDACSEVGQHNHRDNNSSWIVATLCVVLLLVYAFATIVWEVPLGVTTTIFVSSLGFILAWRDNVLAHRRVSSAIVAAAIGLGVLFHFVFTKLFEIGL